MTPEQLLTAKQMEEAAVSILAARGGWMPLEEFTEAVTTTIGVENAVLFRNHLITTKQIELMGDQRVRLPFTPPTPAEQP
jgi:hypothetical protein